MYAPAEISPEVAAPVSPFSIRATAVAHFTFAGLTLAWLLLHGAVEEGIDRGLASTLSTVDTPGAQAMRRTLERATEIRDGLRQHPARRVPASSWVGPLNQTV